MKNLNKKFILLKGSLLRKDSKFFVNLIWANMSDLDSINGSNLDTEIDEKIIEFRDKVLTTLSSYNYHGQDCINDSSWIFESSILFSMALLTTIGYGT